MGWHKLNNKRLAHNVLKTANEIEDLMNRKLAKKTSVLFGGSIQYASLIHLNESNFDQTISQSPVPILVHFSASWCDPCRLIAPVLDEIAKGQRDVVKSRESMWTTVRVFPAGLRSAEFRLFFSSKVAK
jgi:thiol-disulfide isomerase/thioredoxin